VLVRRHLRIFAARLASKRIVVPENLGSMVGLTTLVLMKYVARNAFSFSLMIHAENIGRVLRTS
jgi:hypothetical protein